jgi:hypothetical protein
MSHKKILTASSLSVSVQLIERRIYLIRGQKVMIDSDLAELYGVPTKRLNERVARNKKRFPEDFMFRLTKKEAEFLRSHFAISSSNLRSQFATSNEETMQLRPKTENLRSQFATSSLEHGGRRYLPRAFTEQGVAMLSTVLNSEQAIEVNIAIMRAFVRLRQMLETNEELNRKFVAVIRKLSTHDKYFRVVFDELQKLADKPPPPRRQIGFKKNS